MRNQRLIMVQDLATVSAHRHREERQFPNLDALLPSGLGYQSDLMRRPCARQYQAFYRALVSGSAV